MPINKLIDYRIYWIKSNINWIHILNKPGKSTAKIKEVKTKLSNSKIAYQIRIWKYNFYKNNYNFRNNIKWMRVSNKWLYSMIN